MEVIACIASASQLVAYSVSCAHYSSFRSEETNINLLLDVIRRLSTQEIQESDPVLRILVDISGLACEILHHLQPKSVWIRWNTITLRSKLASLFETLDRKAKLLHLYITQASSSALEAIRIAVDENTTFATSFLEQTMAEPGPFGKVRRSDTAQGVG
jgi:hypothetical protein